MKAMNTFAYLISLLYALHTLEYIVFMYAIRKVSHLQLKSLISVKVKRKIKKKDQVILM